MRLSAAETYVVVEGLKMLLAAEDVANDEEIRELVSQTLKRFERSHAALARLEW